LASFLVGCNQAGTPTPAGSPAAAAQREFDTESGPFAAGKKVVVAAGCFRCHSIDGVRGPVAGAPAGKGGMMGRSQAPDLGKVGKDPEHTVEWLMAYVRNPKSEKPDAKMPPFEGKVNDGDLRSLAEYLASLK
jgi:cbb3-type cytochrome oxidase cytochrome c subunit